MQVAGALQAILLPRIPTAARSGSFLASLIPSDQISPLDWDRLLCPICSQQGEVLLKFLLSRYLFLMTPHREAIRCQELETSFFCLFSCKPRELPHRPVALSISYETRCLYVGGGEPCTWWLYPLLEPASAFASAAFGGCCHPPCWAASSPWAESQVCCFPAGGNFGKHGGGGERKKKNKQIWISKVTKRPLCVCILFETRSDVHVCYVCAL